MSSGELQPTAPTAPVKREYEAEPAEPPATEQESKLARPSGIELGQLGLSVGDRVEGVCALALLPCFPAHLPPPRPLRIVLWDVEMSDGSADSVWWPAILGPEDGPPREDQRQGPNPYAGAGFGQDLDESNGKRLKHKSEFSFNPWGGPKDP